jgi:hypothetical protein
MLGRLLLLGITGLAAWKYRDSLREYVKGNAGPAREKVLLGRSKSLRALGSAREKLSAEAWEVDRGRPTG